MGTQTYNTEQSARCNVSFKPPVAYAAVRSNATVLLLLIYYLLLLPLLGVLCLIIVLLFSTLCMTSFAIILMGKRELVTLL